MSWKSDLVSVWRGLAWTWLGPGGGALVRYDRGHPNRDTML